MPKLVSSGVSALWWARGVTLLISALAAGSLTYWTLRLGEGGSPERAPLAGAGDVPPQDPLALARALGGGQVAAVAPQPELSSRFALLGVLADRVQGGAALISVDGQPAKPFRVGATVEGALVLKSVLGRQAQLAASVNAPTLVRLDMPALPQ